LAKKTQTSSPEVDDSTRHVDIVDDDGSVRKALGRLLHSVGIRSSSYASALLYLESADPGLADCLLLDLHLPGMSGIELLEHLREATPDLPVICMTGREDPEMEQRLAAAGGAPCLRKPFDQVDLFMAFSKVMGDSWEGR